MSAIIRRSLIVTVALAAPWAGCRAINPLAPPGQPSEGPGGSDYVHASVQSKRIGQGNEEYWIFLPDEPAPAEAPLVIFLHGWSAIDPRAYGAWIRHIVRKGHIVVYPRYQETMAVPADSMVANAELAVRNAWARLNSEEPVRPRADGVAWVGHSFGGLLTAILASRSVEMGLPPPAIIMPVEAEGPLAVPPLTTVPAATLVLAVVGDADVLVSDAKAREILAGLAHLPAENVGLVTIRSELRSAPRLRATHLAPLAVDASFPPPVEGVDGSASTPTPIEVLREQRLIRNAERLAPNALDFYGFWKLADGLLDAAFRDVHREYALGDTPQQRFMGRLSDGTPMTPLRVEAVR